MTTDSAENLKWLQIRHRASEKRLAEIARRLQNRGIEFLAIKGPATSRYYPEPWTRFYSDIDVCVSADEYRNKDNIRAELEGLGVDLHCEFRNLDTIPWKLVYERAERFEVDGTLVFAPRREDHLRIIICHWQNDGGRRADKLKDVLHCVSTAGVFDWNLCLDGLSEVRRNWIAKGIGSVERFLGVKFPEHPFGDSETELPSWFVRTVEEESRREDIRPIAFSGSASAFLRELKGKFPPNPIRATIDSECEFGRTVPRIAQLKSLLGRSEYFLKFFILKKR